MKKVVERIAISNTYLKDGDYTSIKDIVLRVGNYDSERLLFGKLDDQNNIVYVKAGQFKDDIINFSNGLVELGLNGKHFAIVSENCYKYVLLDTALSSNGSVVSPIGVDSDEALLKILFNKADIEYVCCTTNVLEKVSKVLKDLDKENHIITVDKKIDGLYFIDEIIELGIKSKTNYYVESTVDGDKLAKILFTSGTTGPNKPVMLSQTNLARNAMNCINTIEAVEGNTSMSVLPMHHGAEMNTHIFARVATGRLTYICHSMRDMMRDVKIFKPNNITIVPLIANLFATNIKLNVKKKGLEKKFNKGIKLCKLVRKFGKDITHKLFKDMYEPFGGNLNMLVCGGATISSDVAKFLSDIGMPVTNGYGISECGPLVSMNTDCYNYPSSIGKVCPGLEWKLDNVNEEGAGELCVKGPSVSCGYYKLEEDTKAVFDQDGFFHTGDICKKDKADRLYIVGRSKNIIILENGKNVSPEELEEIITKAVPILDDVVVYANTRVVNNKESSIIECGVYVDSQKTVSKETIEELFKQINSQLPAYKRINYVNLATSPYPRTALRKIIRKDLLKLHNEEGIKL